MSDTAPPAIPFDEEAYRVALPVFEGPLDLLLHLIQKHELNILDIPISFITEKYLEHIRLMQVLNLDIAAEYLVMAATLAYIKSRELLPTPPPEETAIDGATEPEEDPRAALVRRLLEYQKFKAAAEDLAARGIAGRDVFPRGADVSAEISGDHAPLAPVPLFALMEALQRVAAKKKLSIAHEVTAERVSISERISELIDLLRSRRTAVFDELFDADRTTTDIVVTFLALLEMTRLRMTRLYQASPLAPIHIALVMRDADPAAPTRSEPAGGALPSSSGALAHGAADAIEMPPALDVLAPTGEPEDHSATAVDSLDVSPSMPADYAAPAAGEPHQDRAADARALPLESAPAERSSPQGRDPTTPTDDAA